MGTSQSKQRGKGSTKGSVKGQNVTGPAPAERWSTMEGPKFPCSYLGFVALSKPPTGASVLQTPLKDMYFKYRRQSTGHHSAHLKLTQQGVLVALLEDGQIHRDLFLEFSGVLYVEALRFTATRGDKKPRAVFSPVDESRPSPPDKAAFTLDKSLHFLATAAHPPLVVCVVRRPSGVKAMDCHVFALDTVENALHIAALIDSTQTPASPEHDNRKGSFERKSRNDVIRTEFGEYNIYRGCGGGHEGGLTSAQIGYFSSPGDVQVNRQRHSLTSATSQSVHGGMMLTQEDFHRPQMLTQEDFHRQPPPPQTKSPYSPESIGGFRYGPPPESQRPDILRQMAGNLDESRESREHHNRSYGSGSEAVLRHHDKRHSGGQRLSDGQAPPPVAAKPTTPRSLDLSPSPRYPPISTQLSPRNPDVIQPHSQHRASPRSSASMSPRSSSITSPSINSPSVLKQLDLSNTREEIFSASNLESRGESDIPEQREPEDIYSGRPVAKVPPHMKAGIKVLPSDFRAVKLKPKLSRNSDSFDDSDSSKDVLINKYRDMQERERVLGDFDNRKDAHTIYTHGAGRVDNRQQHADNNNKEYTATDINSNRHYDNERSSFHMNPHHDNHQELSAKDAEIANMFTDFHISKGHGNPVHRQHNDFENGLGYLP